ncbi:MAG TPA: hypothetical protein VIT68_01995, partial [Candidatus Gracilibacteria bacterium]
PLTWQKIARERDLHRDMIEMNLEVMKELEIQAEVVTPMRKDIRDLANTVPSLETIEIETKDGIREKFNDYVEVERENSVEQEQSQQAKEKLALEATLKNLIAQNPDKPKLEIFQMVSQNPEQYQVGPHALEVLRTIVGRLQAAQAFLAAEGNAQEQAAFARIIETTPINFAATDPSVALSLVGARIESHPTFRAETRDALKKKLGLFTGDRVIDEAQRTTQDADGREVPLYSAQKPLVLDNGVKVYPASPTSSKLVVRHRIGDRDIKVNLEGASNIGKEMEDAVRVFVKLDLLEEIGFRDILRTIGIDKRSFLQADSFDETEELQIDRIFFALGDYSLSGTIPTAGDMAVCRDKLYTFLKKDPDTEPHRIKKIARGGVIRQNLQETGLYGDDGFNFEGFLSTLQSINRQYQGSVVPLSQVLGQKETPQT